MTSGPAVMRAPLPLSVALALMLALAGGSAPLVAASPTSSAVARSDEGPLTLQRLMALLAHRKHAHARFEEQQDLAVLTEPLHSSGVLTYDAPDHLEQLTLEPRRELMRLDGTTLTVQLGAHRRTLALADQPRLAPLIDSLRATLAGDGAALARQFRVKLDGTVDEWQLQLSPRERTPVATVSIAGTRDRISQVQIVRTDGDRVRMRIEPLP